MNPVSTQTNTNILASNTSDVTSLNDIISNQKKYFTMYITNKSAEMAKNFESEIKNIITNSLTDEINKIVTHHISQVTLNFDSKIKEIKEIINSELSFEQEKLSFINLKLEKLQTSFYADVSEYIDDIISNQIQNRIDNTLRTSDDAFVSPNDTLKKDLNKTTELNNQDSLLLNNHSDVVVEKQKEIAEITNLLQEIDQLKMDIYKIVGIKDLKDQISIALETSPTTLNNEFMEHPSSSNFGDGLTTKFSDISLRLKNNISENINLSFRVNKYSTLLLSSIAIVFMISQVI